jgi:hypothetical protein
MEHQPSNQSITIIKTHLLAALNGVVIKRYEYDENGQRGDVIQTIAVPIKYSHKTRQIHEAIQINGHITLPAMAVSLTGFSIDNNRNEGKREPMYDYEYVGKNGIIRHYKPTPINMSFNLMIVTTKGSDMEEILEHYLSVFNPYIYISSKHPFTNKEIRTKILWAGSVSTNYPTDTDATNKIRYICNLPLQVEGWVYKEKLKNGGIIKQIDYNIAFLNSLDCSFDGDELIPDESHSLSGMPTIYDITPNCINAGGTVLIDGESFNHLDGVFFLPVSGFSIPTSSWNPFKFNEQLSADFPEFDAYPVDSWQKIDNNRIVITIPEELSGTNVEIGLINKHCGIITSSEVIKEGGCNNPIIYIT